MSFATVIWLLPMDRYGGLLNAMYPPFDIRTVELRERRDARHDECVDGLPFVVETVSPIRDCVQIDVGKIQPALSFVSAVVPHCVPLARYRYSAW